ncbi:hypothetical protein SAMN05421766_105141 [Zobellia uliginosa]|uniref:Peptidase E n=1 Tax=Zobellia uliginosa TaxID=143224 RepID=A0ABY1KYV5_9FLAO|nr:DUF6702 family protein [Zobellia uliginosa]MDO6519235.1 hypothetical protein [Zobellia uliginosa]SIS95003.1 hypothetical protein SAMN05421766_105141 [Zobellia uliginosa]
MKSLKKLLVLLLLPLMAFTAAHKFYVSVTNVNYSEKDKALQITSRIFIDDLDKLLLERYDLKAQLATGEESPLADAYLEKYLRAKFVIEVNGNNADYTYIGKKYDADVVIFYIEVPNVDKATLKSVQIENEILTDLFDEQQNVVHFKIGDQKKSFVLVKSRTKGMLNL